MNYLLPVQVGAPDYKNYLTRLAVRSANKNILSKNTNFLQRRGYFNFMIPINNNKFCSYSVLSYTKVTNSQSIGSYLAGLFELFSQFARASSVHLIETTEVSSITAKTRNRKYITDGLDQIPLPISENLIGLLLGDVHA